MYSHDPPTEPTNAAAGSHNRRAWDRMVQQQQRFTKVASDEDFQAPLRTIDRKGWLGASIAGQRVLCLASGGGRHGPLYAAAGAQVTVVDISPAQLELDRHVAQQRRLELRTVETSMDDLSMFRCGEFDLVVHPVSTCYLPDVGAVYREVARVTATNGLYISQHKQPVSLQAEAKPNEQGYAIREPYYRRGPLPAVTGSLHREAGTHEFLHRWEQLLGWMCRAGFAIEDLTEPEHANPTAIAGSFGHRSLFIAPYVRIKARRRSDAPPAQIVLPSGVEPA